MRGRGETADTQGLGPCARKGVGVQLPSSAPNFMKITSQIKKQEDGTIELTVTVPWSAIVEAKKEVINEHVKEAELPGFRKGMAPLEKVEQSLDKAHIKEDILRKILPGAYAEAVKTNPSSQSPYFLFKIFSGEGNLINPLGVELLFISG